MTTKPASRMLPLQLPMTTYENLTELGTPEKLTVTQVVKTILEKALELNAGKATLAEILAVFSRGDSQAATQPSRPLRVSVLKR